MVRREGTRFGVSTNHNVRRLAFPYPSMYAQQNVVVETKTDGSPQALKRARGKLSKHLQERNFPVQDNGTRSVMLSLNKSKRWEVIDDIKEDEDRCHDDCQSVVAEHHILPRSSSRSTCIAVFDQSADKVKRSPRKTYAKVADLRGKDQQDKEDENVGEDKNFGKKNSKRSRKRSSRDEHQFEVATSSVRYDVSLAAPKHTFQSMQCHSGNSDVGKKNRNSRNRTKKLQYCNVSDELSDGFWQLSEEDSFYCDQSEEEAEYWQEETKEAEPHQRCQFSLEAFSNAPRSCKASYFTKGQTSSPKEELVSTKDRIFRIDKVDAITAIHPEYITCIRETRKVKKMRKIAEAKQEAESLPPVTIQAKPSVAVSVKADDITAGALQGKFGERYAEGSCMPRRFTVNITDTVIEQLQCTSNQEDAAALRKTGHHFFMIIDCGLDPWMVMRGDQGLVEEVRVKVCGLTEEQQMMDQALSHLQDVGISDVINAVSQAVAEQPFEHYLIERSSVSIATKPAVAFGTVQSALGWQYGVTQLNTATEESLAKPNQDVPETGALSPSGASNACEVCAICYEELTEKCTGTALEPCNHWFCDECWRNHIMSRIEQGDINITCPEFKCTAPVDRVTIMSLIPSKYYWRHHGNQTNTALMRQPELHWCPSPRCGRLIRLGTTGKEGDGAHKTQTMGVAVNCECGTFWCSECKEEAHWPATCDQAKVYRKKAQTLFKVKDSMLIRVTTKRCPHCGYPIEKFYGCNHMVCKCGFDFCWECGKRFDSTHYNCTQMKKWKFHRFDLGPEGEVASSAIDRAVAHHRKRTHSACHRRYRKARKLAAKVVNSRDVESGSDYDEEKTALGDAPVYDPLSASAVPSVPCPDQRQLLREMRAIFIEAAGFLSEGEFVLEHLEILLSGAPVSSHRQLLLQHKTRLHFIIDHLHKIFAENGEVNIAKIQHFLHCGKTCLHWLALTVKQFTTSLAGSTKE